MTHCATVPQVGTRANSLYSNFQHELNLMQHSTTCRTSCLISLCLSHCRKRQSPTKAKIQEPTVKKTPDTHESRLDPHGSSRTCTKAETFLSCIAYIIKIQPEDAPFTLGSQTSPHALWARNGGSEPRRQCPQMPPPYSFCARTCRRRTNG